jgi:hypothetical protein
MPGEKKLDQLLKKMKPTLNEGDYVFCTREDMKELDFNDIIFAFKEQEGITIVLKQEMADRLQLEYSFVAKWITLTVHSSLESVGLTAAFSKALTKENTAVTWWPVIFMTIFSLTKKTHRKH